MDVHNFQSPTTSNHRIANRALDASDRCGVYDDLRTFHGSLQAFEIEHVALDLVDIRVPVIGRSPEACCAGSCR